MRRVIVILVSARHKTRYHPAASRSIPAAGGSNLKQESSMTPTPADTGVRTHAHEEGHQMTKKKGLLVTVAGRLVFQGDLEPWTHKPARDGRPEMWRSKVNGVEIWCKEVDPATFVDGKIVGKLEVKLNQVTQHVGADEESWYLYVNVLPLEGATPTAIVSIVRPPKKGSGRERRKMLPIGFNPATDFVVERGRQPWQVITVR